MKERFNFKQVDKEMALWRGREGGCAESSLQCMGFPSCGTQASLVMEMFLLKMDMEQRTSSKSGKEYFKAVYCHPACLMFMQSTSCEMPGWMKHKLESRLLREISSDVQMYQPYGRKRGGTKEPLDENERGEWKMLA